MLASQVIDGSELQEQPTWAWFKWSGAGVFLSAGAYWLVSEHDGTVSPTAYYKVRMTEAAFEVCKAYTGTAWVTNPTGAYIPFKL